MLIEFVINQILDCIKIVIFGTFSTLVGIFMYENYINSDGGGNKNAT
jgi:hypothetical protein